jgi:formamidopyrimidine-DNA glycosylase
VPELPEVETYCRYFARHALHQRITKVNVRDERILLDVRKETFARALRGKQFASVRRHGKHLFADAGATWLHLHFGMTGDLAYYSDRKDEPRFSKIVFDFEGSSHLAFEDMRLFGFAELVTSPEDYVREHGLGPDPMERSFTAKTFERLLDGRRGAVKSLLMSQDIIAGLGNLYVDEILFQSGIHPKRTIDRIKPAERRAIYSSMRTILREAVRRRAVNRDLPASYLFNHREAGELCPRCGGTISRTVVFGRTTYFCRRHQR